MEEKEESGSVAEKVYARPWIEVPRDLIAEDYANMNLPEKFFDASFRDMDEYVYINGEKTKNKAKAFVCRYLERLSDMRAAGMGLGFNGPNGGGKTYAACVILKAFRMHGQSCTYAHVETFRQSLFSDEVLDLAGRPLKSRCFEADVLLIDDLGKEVKSKGSGYELYAIEHLVRERYNRNKVTLYTTNMSNKVLREHYKKSTMSVIEGNTTAFTMLGDNKRLGANQDIKNYLKGR
jgi:DNA replication protein DnaC